MRARSEALAWLDSMGSRGAWVRLASPVEMSFAGRVGVGGGRVCSVSEGGTARSAVKNAIKSAVKGAVTVTSAAVNGA